MSQTPDFVLFLGRFHPLVVHLPIGFLFFAFVLEIFGKKKKYENITVAIPLALMLGFLSALIACILGYMLSLSGDYDENMLDSHFWFGVFTTVLTLVAWLIRVDKIKLPNKNKLKANISALTVIVILLSVTGHYGGNLTHGSDYLTKYMPFNKKEEKVLVPVEKVEDAVVFDYLVAPILDAKCTSCHNESKKKGGLSLIDSLSIMKGGKGGEAVVVGSANKSEIVKRVLLDPHHEDFMPPEGKTPLTEEEIAVITYWINNAFAGFSNTVGAVKTPENITKIASNMLGLSAGAAKQASLKALPKIPDDVLKEIVAQGFRVSELVFNSNIYAVELPANTVTANNSSELKSKLETLAKIKDNILWLYLEDNQITDSYIDDINQFKNVQKLKLNKNNITDAGISKINLPQLEVLNLFGTKITKASLPVLANIKTLNKVYIWNTSISKEDIENTNLENDVPDFVLN
ncbi:hypothetical protein FUA26_13500 [Seonamhaeicola algicola]|uniref:Cytochrome c domain-containing protein n=1 Tax=Seonamhaeicola algicola TaxID=1719036 RepID=A0A5C7AFM7_9FLAO|nr:DUF2231 domain-containing protein [Seonamhaeicola algicola]TXE07231.1 hypothetical protein FUA26_13500 [Seonamhaeicola algicola]